jgi:hypothetical protein
MEPLNYISPIYTGEFMTNNINSNFFELWAKKNMPTMAIFVYSIYWYTLSLIIICFDYVFGSNSDPGMNAPVEDVTIPGHGILNQKSIFYLMLTAWFIYFCVKIHKKTKNIQIDESNKYIAIGAIIALICGINTFSGLK